MRITFALLAVLLASQASAQAENKITLSGRAWGSVENVYTTGAPGATANVLPRYRVTNDSSFIRVRGDLKLTQDLSAFGQVEAQFALDGAGGPFDSGRNTGVGFTSKAYGTITAGRWDSPYKLAAIRLDPWGNTTINNYAAILGQHPRNGGGNIYDARLTNGVQYWSPVISNVQVKLAAEVNEDRTAGDTINPSALSASVTYDGPVYLAAAFETRKDCSNAGGGGASPTCTSALLGTHGRDWGLRLGAGYNYKPTRSEVGFVWERLYALADVGPNSVTQGRTAWYLSLVQGIKGDVHQFVGAFGLADKTSGNALVGNPNNDKTGALYYTLAYKYNFNKDLFVYASFVQIRNDDNAGYRFGSSGLNGAAGNPVGANYSGWSIGSRYVF